jgi:hypothetical protein
MSTIEEHITLLHAKLQLLLKKYAALQKENLQLNSEIEDFRKNQAAALQRINTLELQTDILKTSAGQLTDQEKLDFERRINQYIKDLDKCITILNN